MPLFALLLSAAWALPGPADARPKNQSKKELTEAQDQVLQLYHTGRYGEAIPFAERALALAERVYGPKHLEVASVLNGLGLLYNETGRDGDALAAHSRALSLREKALGPEHPSVAVSLNNLGTVYLVQGRFTDAEPVLRRALAIREKAFDPEHTDVGQSLNNIAYLLQQQGRYAETEPVLARALAIFEKALGPEHVDLATILGNIAHVYGALARHAEADTLHRRALTIRERGLGPDHPLVAYTLNNLAMSYLFQARYAEAERPFKRALEIWETRLGPDHAMVATVLSNLGELYRAQGRYAEAEPLYKRSVAIREKGLGPEHPDFGISLNNLAGLYLQQRRHAEAEPLYRRTIAIFEKALGPDHPHVATSLNDLAVLQEGQGRQADSERLKQRAVAIFEKALGPEHPDVAQALVNLAVLLETHGRFADAEALKQRGLAIFRNALGPDHPFVGMALHGLAVLHFSQSKWAEAAQYGRQATQHSVRRTKRSAHATSPTLTGTVRSEADRDDYRFRNLVKAGYRLTDAPDSPTLAAEMLEAAQWALSSAAAASLAQMAARQSKGDGALAHLVRERQDLTSEWQSKDKALTAARSHPPTRRDRQGEAVLSARLVAIDDRIAAIDARLAVDFPEYAALASPGPLSLGEIQGLLGKDEALVLFLDTATWKPTPEETFIWVVTKTEARWVRSDLGTKALAAHVGALRCGLDDALWNHADSADKCVEMVKKHRYDANIEGQFVRVLPFDLERAHELYKALLGSVRSLIDEKHLLVVPSGPLTSLPFSALVTEPPKTRIPDNPAGYREAAWLGTQQAITVLPSVPSLKALREQAKVSRAIAPYFGVGNPLLDGAPGDDHSKQAEVALQWQNCSTVPDGWHAAPRGRRSIPGLVPLFRGLHANIEYLRQQSPLPETAYELCRIARGLGVPESEILLGSRATETTVKDQSERGRLANYRIVHFATHGALAGELKGLSEPGLILTPPPRGTSDSKLLDRDDGYLTASEIATLKLDADWVILSACNTAGPAGETAEALSGLARAFFYAGARTLLVSHWAVGSDAAVKLTTRAFEELKFNPAIGRAEAFRVSIRELIHSGALTDAHPMQWAAFVVVGEGAR